MIVLTPDPNADFVEVITASFKAMDANMDGAITKFEYEDYFCLLPIDQRIRDCWVRTDIAKQQRARFVVIDKNGDSIIDTQEQADFLSILRN